MKSAITIHSGSGIEVVDSAPRVVGCPAMSARWRVFRMYPYWWALTIDDPVLIWGRFATWREAYTYADEQARQC